MLHSVSATTTNRERSFSHIPVLKLSSRKMESAVYEKERAARREDETGLQSDRDSLTENIAEKRRFLVSCEIKI